ncbi:hypothetical protein Amet_1015 [Alkaliphilus metalliredigens QYMF]|uniref:Spo0E like sporulation regulatory protein n=1 Tax=Alkaliphilus metalliredigens (strain QYMF) TaxID=293826 RepID=A6TM14_ALKMQ|nr:Spo0E family sporulation regulatory protein-aspartic acid phosphatase [Alkaliphilus metalliredigens]ABR47232.1 hypothetical protein Amet_1015 [Alkaliphilus metalliredigens QYMF]
MKREIELEQKIKLLKKELSKYTENKDVFLTPKMLNISKKIDEFIIKYGKFEDEEEEED